MVHRLLLAAAVVAAAAAVGEYQKVLQGCGCGDPVQTYNTTTAAFCPTSQYPLCNISKMSVSDNTCSFSCTGPRSRLVYRNNSVVWLATTSISCEKNADGITATLKNSEGETLYNVLRPTCAYKAACEACTITYQPTCPTGMTCKEANMERTTGPDDCSQLACKDGTLNLYTSNGAPMPYIARKLLCTVVAKWTNYSIDGSIVGGTLINETISANCVLPKACEECVDPNWITNLAALPTPFRTGYVAIAGSRSKEAGSCSEFTCPTGYTLYGFSGTSTAVTGLEYTSKGKLRCSGTSQWTNGGVENIPSNMLAACLKVIPPCQKCASNLIAVTQTGVLAKPMDGDVTTTSGSCAERTFTCNAKHAYIDIFGVDGKNLGLVDGMGTVTFNVVCNAAGTAWESYGHPIGRLECLGQPVCQSCGSNLIAVTNSSAGAKKMDSDVITTTNGCSERIFTCKGTDASIEIWGENDTPLVPVTDMGTGTASFHASCNAAGTAWEEQEIIITRVECTNAPTCKSCASNAIAVTQTSPGAKPFDSDAVSTVNDCAQRKFTCKGKKASIEMWTADGDSLGPIIEDGSGFVTLTVNCNAAGAAWETEGYAITRVECAVPPACQTCAASLISTEPLDPMSKPMDGDEISIENGCSVRTFTCNALPGKKASIEIMGLGSVSEPVAGTANLWATCNAAGTAWEEQGMVITDVECMQYPGVPPKPTAPANGNCTTCPANLIEITTYGDNTKQMDSDVISMTNGCAKRTFTCKGKNAKIQIWMWNPRLGFDESLGKGDDRGTGTDTISFDCNAAGTGWEWGQPGDKVDIVRVECSATGPLPKPACQTCAPNRIATGPHSPGAKPMDGDEISIVDGCSVRTFSCTGKQSAIIEITGENGMPLGSIDDAASGTANVWATCNAAGTAWEDHGTAITGVECFEYVAPPTTTNAPATGNCANCAVDQITISFADFFAKPMDGAETVAMPDGCAQRTFTCIGIDAQIAVQADYNPPWIFGNRSRVATYTVTCNGQFWEGVGELKGSWINWVECRHV